MNDLGKKLRMAKIFREDGKSLIFAFDHGAFLGPTGGAEKAGEVLADVIEGGVDAVMTTLGIIKNYSASLAKKRLAWILTILDKSPENVEKSVNLACKLGVDGVKLFVTLGTETQQRELGMLWALTRVSNEYGMPVLAEMYPVKTEKNPDPTSADSIRRASRIGAEYGADFIKTFYTGSGESFRTVVAACPIPIVILGGEKTNSDLELLNTVHSAVKAGAAGAAIGRNIFEHENPKAIANALSMVIHQSMTPEQAFAKIA